MIKTLQNWHMNRQVGHREGAGRLDTVSYLREFTNDRAGDSSQQRGGR